MTNLWEKLTNRAKELASQRPETAELLKFYARLLETQAEIHATLTNMQGWLPAGILSDDLSAIRSTFPMLLKGVRASGPPKLTAEAERLLSANQSEVDELLKHYWIKPGDIQFFAKAIFQPYFRRLFETGTKPSDRGLPISPNSCPFCGGRPQLSYMTAQDPAADGGTRQLLCSNCFNSWPFRRVVCANCNEERPSKLAYFHTAEYDFVRIDACDTCHSYLKSIDLARYGLAVPLVDEVAAAPLDVWAVEHGYSKIELNIVGI